MVTRLGGATLVDRSEVSAREPADYFWSTELRTQLNMSLETPVAFLIFNRPDLTQRVFKVIAEAKPSKLLVIADGPAKPEQVALCEKARAAVQVDWDCEVLTNFSDSNLGCRQRVSSGISWVFSQVEQAIILEDDCLPAPSFFSFCEALLDRYRDDERVMHIGGTNVQQGQSRTPSSYYFSRYTHIWGWATWRRAWRHYNVEMPNWPQDRELIQKSFRDPIEAEFWLNKFDKVHAGAIDTWDFQWVYGCWSQSGLAVIPSVNLVSNIGFGPGATHTHEVTADSCLPVGDIWEINHPHSIIRHQEADAYTFDHSFDGIYLKQAARDAARGPWKIQMDRAKGLAYRTLRKTGLR